jgi:hypothetical protein
VNTASPASPTQGQAGRARRGGAGGQSGGLRGAGGTGQVVCGGWRGWRGLGDVGRAGEEGRLTSVSGDGVAVPDFLICRVPDSIIQICCEWVFWVVSVPCMLHFEICIENAQISRISIVC